MFGRLISIGHPWALSGGCLAAAALMLAAAVTEAAIGVDAEGKSLENVAEPLSS